MEEVFKIYKISSYGRGTNNRVYEVSNLGRVKLNGEIVEPKMLYAKKDFGYYVIGGFRIHRAVAELFVPNPDNKPYVDHINTDRLDNRACNLRWVTQKENCNNSLSKKHISDSTKGRKWSAETLLKRGQTLKGKTPWNKGIPVSDETKAKLHNAISGKHWKLVDGKRVYYDKCAQNSLNSSE